MSRGNPTQPPLDLRLLSHSSPMQHSFQVNSHNQHHHHHHHHHHSKEKYAAAGDDNNRTNSIKASKKDDTSPDWNLMSVKRSKEKDAHKGLKIPDWSLEEERRFRLDTESKDNASMKRCVAVESLAPDGAMVNSSTTSKKRSGKRNHTQDVTPESISGTTEIHLADIQIVEKKNLHLTKSSPTTNGKSKSSKDEASKLVDHEAQLEAASAFANTNTKDSSKSEGGKRKQSSTSNNGGSANHTAFRKYDANASQKVTQYSEEETSSTTTESSIQDDSNTYKVILFIFYLFIPSTEVISKRYFSKEGYTLFLDQSLKL